MNKTNKLILKTNVLTIVMIIFLFSIISVKADVFSGIDYYNLDNKLNSSSTNNSLINGNISYGTGQINQAVYFDNESDYIRNNSFNFNHDLSFSIGFGLKLNNTYMTGTKTNNYVFSTNSMSVGNSFLVRMPINNVVPENIGIDVCKESSACTTSPYFAMNTTKFDYVLIVYNGSTKNISLYVNNVLYYTTINGYTTATLINTGFSFGNEEKASYSISPRMIVDEISVYNRVLDSSERTNLYNNFTNLISYPFVLNYSINPSVLIIPCNSSITLNSSGVNVFFNWTTKNTTTQTKINFYKNIIENYTITNTTGNITLYNNLTNGSYSIYLKDEYIDNSTYYYDTNCKINICVSNWNKTTTQCISNLKLINYVDTNNCPVVYDLPSTNGTYEDCSLPPSTDKELWLIILLLVTWLILIILTLWVALFLIIPAFIIASGMIYYFPLYFTDGGLLLGIIFLVATLFTMVSKYVVSKY